jgi:hypothetical protein
MQSANNDESDIINLDTIIHNTDFLSKKNAHERDMHIQFFEHGHKYVITPNLDGTPYTSVTTRNHAHFSKFDADAVISNIIKGRNWNESNKYWGMTPDQIKQQWADSGSSAAALGTQLHFQIECYINDAAEAANAATQSFELGDTAFLNTTHTTMDYDTAEWRYFMDFIEDHPHLVPYRTEWIIFHEEYKLAGSVDMVYENPDGTLSIYDWKRTKDISGNKTPSRWTKYANTPQLSHIPDTNYWHYALQLNTYKMILESKYGKKIKELVLVRLHPLAETYELIPLPDLQKEVTSNF